MRRVDTQENVRILIVDDNYDHASGIRELINIESDYEVIGTAASAEIAVSLVKKYNPEIILMDINMPETDGITAIQEIKKLNEDAIIIAITGYDDADLIFRAMKVGAKGYILKTMAASQLVIAINEVISGKIYLPPILTVKFFDHFYKSFKDDNKNKFEEDEENLLAYLTQREEEVLELLTQGITYKGVANKLFISETTVKTHVNNIFQKLQVNDRTQAVLYAINHSLSSRKKVRAAAV
ncbi:MAG: two component transcriptional regulator, LuxR family [uncultured bacterium]|nr:MAG: two component transcriptional regulator, LuxR family [uncultured bacterium]HBH18652.1 DNA-binding response regulator [Cyanobacteria bacterium UBA9579]